MRVPLPKMHDLGLDLRQLREVLRRQFLEARRAHSMRSPRELMITLCVIFSAPTPTHPGP